MTKQLKVKKDIHEYGILYYLAYREEDKNRFGMFIGRCLPEDYEQDECNKSDKWVVQEIEYGDISYIAYYEKKDFAMRMVRSGLKTLYKEHFAEEFGDLEEREKTLSTEPTNAQKNTIRLIKAEIAKTGKDIKVGEENQNELHEELQKVWYRYYIKLSNGYNMMYLSIGRNGGVLGTYAALTYQRRVESLADALRTIKYL